MLSAVEVGGTLLQAIGISRGGRNSKALLELVEELHALTDGEGRPPSFLLTGGDVADRRAADALLTNLAPRTIVLADKPVLSVVEGNHRRMATRYDKLATNFRSARSLAAAVTQWL